MKKKSSIIPFNCESILDFHTWTISNACLFLLLYKNTFTEEERDYLIKEISRHEMKTKVSAYKFMLASANEIKNNRAIETEKARAFIEFMRIYEIAITKFDIDSEVTPYQFISWAVTKRTIPVHQDLRIWLEEERSKKSNKTVVMRKALEEAKSRIAELEAENDKLRAENEELKNVAPQAGGWDDIPYTLWREVLAMRDTGMTDKEIAEKLHDKGQGASKAQLGALLYSGNAKIPAQKTLQDYGTELFR